MHLAEIEFQCKQIYQINVANGFSNGKLQNTKCKNDVSYTTSIFLKRFSIVKNNKLERISIDGVAYVDTNGKFTLYKH